MRVPVLRKGLSPLILFGNADWKALPFMGLLSQSGHSTRDTAICVTSGCSDGQAPATAPSIGRGRFARCEEEWEDWAIALPVPFRYTGVSGGFGASDRCRPSDRTLDAMHLAEDGWKERAVKVALPSQIRRWNHAVWISVVLVLFSSRVWVAGEARYPIQRGKRSCDPRRNGRARRACPTATSQRSTWSNDRVWRVHRFDTR